MSVFFCRWFCVGGEFYFSLSLFLSLFFVIVGDFELTREADESLMIQNKSSNAITTSVIVFLRTSQSESTPCKTESS